MAEARRLEPAQVRALLDQGLFTTDEARAAGLLDATLWPDELPEWAVAGDRAPAPRRRPLPARAAAPGPALGAAARW